VVKKLKSLKNVLLKFLIFGISIGKMPIRRVRKYVPKKRGGRRALMGRVARPIRSVRFNPQPVFTETFRLLRPDPLAPPYQLNSNTGGILTVRMSQVPQIAQYNSLYTKYRILRAQFICLPQFVTESSDVNAAYYNGSLGLGNWGMARIVTSVQDSPNVPIPVSEDDVLEDNGCKIHTGRPKIVLTCKPVPDTLDAAGNRLTYSNKFINFNVPPAEDTEHFGIRWYYTLPNPGGNIDNKPYFVYCKLTFQLADPR